MNAVQTAIKLNFNNNYFIEVKKEKLINTLKELKNFRIKTTQTKKYKYNKKETIIKTEYQTPLRFIVKQNNKLILNIKEYIYSLDICTNMTEFNLENFENARYNIDYFLKLLKHFKKDVVKISFSESKCPVLIIEQENKLALLMPIGI
jgi:DNA polymerase III sliding clamp (beta) subunit (PCNA family)